MLQLKEKPSLRSPHTGVYVKNNHQKYTPHLTRKKKRKKSSLKSKILTGSVTFRDDGGDGGGMK